MESIGRTLEKALGHYERKEYKEAERLADALIREHPDFQRGTFLKGVILEETGRKAEARRYLDKSESLYNLYFRLALQLHDIDPHRALQYYDRVTQMEPNTCLAWYYKGLAYERIGRVDEAKACFSRISTKRELISKIMVPLGFMVLLVVGAVMMFSRGENTLSWFVVASAVFCLFWLKRDAGTAIRMFAKKKKYNG